MRRYDVELDTSHNYVVRDNSYLATCRSPIDGASRVFVFLGILLGSDGFNGRTRIHCWGGNVSQSEQCRKIGHADRICFVGNAAASPAVLG